MRSTAPRPAPPVAPAPRFGRVLTLTATLTATAVLAASAVLGSTTSAGATPGTGAPLTTRARAARIPVLRGEAFTTHTHTIVHVTVNGTPVTIPARIGIDAANQRITAVHTHDTSGTVHVESPNAGDRYRLDQFLTLWGVGRTKASLCRSLARTPRCTVKVSSSTTGPTTLRSRLDDQDTLTVALTTSAATGTTGG